MTSSSFSKDVTELGRLRRLQSLGILDTSPDPHFDAVCRSAQALFDVPIALVTLLDDRRQWFKANCGLSVGETPRDISFCTHAILADDAFVVEDAANDPRFAANPLVLGAPHIRFYAGAPLVFERGMRFGTLCIIDTVPRTFTQAQCRQLEDLALVVVALLRLHEAKVVKDAELVEQRKAKRLIHDQHRLLQVQAAELYSANNVLLTAEKVGRVGHWRIDRAHREVTWSEGAARIFGHRPKKNVLSLEEHLGFYHPDDRSQIHAQTDVFINGGNDELEYRSRILRPNGEQRVLSIRRFAERNAAGETTAVFCVGTDITTFAQTEAQLLETTTLLRATLENMDQGLVMVGPDKVVRVHNQRALTFSGGSVEELSEAFCGGGAFAPETYQQESRLRTFECAGQNGIALEIRRVALPDGGEVRTYTDITERLRRETALRNAEAEYRALFNKASVGLYRATLSGKLTHANPALVALAGYSSDTEMCDDVNASSGAYYCVPERGSDYAKQVREHGCVNDFLAEVYRHDTHERFWISQNAWTVFGHDGEPLYLEGTIFDATDRKRAETILTNSERRYRSLADVLPQMIYTTEPKRRELTYANKQFHSYFGDIGNLCESRLGTVHPDDLGRAEAVFAVHIRELRRTEVELRFCRHDGVYRWHRLVWTPSLRDDGEFECLGTALDIDDIVTSRRKLEESTDLLRLAQDAAGAGIWDWDMTRDRVWLSPECAHMCQVDSAGEACTTGGVEVDLQCAIARILPEDARELLAGIQLAIKTRTIHTFEFRVNDRAMESNDCRWIQTFGRLIYDPVTDAPVRMVGLNFDITERKRAEEALRVSETMLRESRERLALALDAGSDGLWDVNLVTGRVWVSDRVRAMLGYEAGDIETDIEAWKQILHPEDKEHVINTLDAESLAGDALWMSEHRLRTRSGLYIWVQARGRFVTRDADGKAIRMVGTHVDITARREAEERIAYMALHDGLTGLPNRALFRDRLDHELATVERTGGKVAVFCLDLDRFKAVNDTLGHPAGDTLLHEIACRLHATLQAGGMIARMGGDEFAVLQVIDAAEQQGTLEMRALAQQLIDAVGRPIAIEGQHITMGVSIGVAVAPDDGRDRDELFKRADMALYHAKEDGRNTFRFFEGAMNEAVEERRRLELGLRGALGRAEFEVHYQPILDIATGAITGFEALVRWRHPERGLVPPAAFIPLAEETGLIVPIGTWVLRTACHAVMSWPGSLTIAVNVSAIQFRQEGLVQEVISALAASGLPAHRLELEITESVLMQDSERVLKTLHRLRAIGVRIALDDFGTGYSSLGYLRRYPFDKLKIDRSFVKEIANPDAIIIVRAIISLGTQLGIAITAEGVETESQFELVQAEGCTEIQGYLISPPVPFETVATLIRPQIRVTAA